MSHSTNTPKVISTFHIELSAAFKAVLDAHAIEMTKTQEAIASFKATMITGHLLDAIQPDKDENVAEPELQKIGQWVFEGQPEYIKSAGLDKNGQLYLSNGDKTELAAGMVEGIFKGTKKYWKCIPGNFDAANWQNSAINRETVNDVDYLSDTPTDDDTAPEVLIFSDEELAAACLGFAPADRHHLFIKNLADVVIQRMHSMDRFSSPDKLLLGRDLKKWDALVSIDSDASADKVFSIAGCSAYGRSSTFFKPQHRTITQAEIPAFLAGLEASYA